MERAQILRLTMMWKGRARAPYTPRATPLRRLLLQTHDAIGVKSLSCRELAERLLHAPQFFSCGKFPRFHICAFNNAVETLEAKNDEVDLAAQMQSQWCSNHLSNAWNATTAVTTPATMLSWLAPALASPSTDWS
jgi:hypothetical protein